MQCGRIVIQAKWMAEGSWVDHYSLTAAPAKSAVHTDQKSSSSCWTFLLHIYKNRNLYCMMCFWRTNWHYKVDLALTCELCICGSTLLVHKTLHYALTEKRKKPTTPQEECINTTHLALCISIYCCRPHKVIMGKLRIPMLVTSPRRTTRSVWARQVFKIFFQRVPPL